MKKPIKEIILREVVWLIIILLISIPLARFTEWLLRSDLTTPAVSDLKDDFKYFAQGYIHASIENTDVFLYFLYFWMVVGCYVARLSASGTKMLVTKIPEDF